MSAEVTCASFTRYSRTWASVLLPLDAAIMLCAAYAAAGLIAGSWNVEALRSRFAGPGLLFVVVELGVFERLGLYRRTIAIAARDEWYSVVAALAIGLVPLIAVLGIARPSAAALQLVVCAAALAAIPITGVRTLAHADPRKSDRVFAGQRSRPRPFYGVLKRMLDLGVAALALCVAAPVLALAALAIVLETGRPIVFRQERVGKGGRRFEIFKLRTMRTDAGSAWARPGDSRITRVGAFLRRTSIDELPQLVNVLRGEMSVVGPRPEMCSFAQAFEERFPGYARRHEVLPGITGWAQVHMKRNLDPSDAADVLAHDLYYVDHRSFFLDLVIVLKTIAEFLFHGAV